MIEGFSPVQQKLIAIIPKPLSILSLVTSLITVIHVSRSPTLRQKTYHKIILAMMICSSIANVSIFIGTWAMPLGTVVFHACGTKTTCMVQGCSLIFSSLSFLGYYATLSLFSFLAIRCNFDEMKLRSYEPWFHFINISISFTITAVGAVKRFINPSVTIPWCTIARYPLGCDGDECHHDPIDLYVKFCFLFMVALLVFPTIMIISLLILEERKGWKNQHLKGKKKLAERLRQRRSADVVKQAAIYLLCLYTILLVYIIAIFKQYRDSIDFPLLFLSAIIASLQGTFVSIVYKQTSLEYRKIPITKQNNQLTEASTTLVSEIRRRSLNPNARNIGDTNLAIQDSRQSFSIFDGECDPSSQWFEFVNTDEQNSTEDVGECGI